MKGRCFIIRFVDDFIIGSQLESDAKRLMEVLPKRFERFALSLHPKKTRPIAFGKPAHNAKPPRDLRFSWVYLLWGNSLTGNWVVKKKTERKRRNRFMRMLWSWCKENRHDPTGEQHATLCSKLRGFYQYFGVRSNFKVLEVVYEHAEKAWKHWLGRRHRGGYISYKKYNNILARYPFPSPRIVHNI